MANKRDLNVNIDGDSRGFQRASKRAQQAAREYQRELDRTNARMIQFAQIGTTLAPPIVAGTAAAAAGMGVAATAAGTLAAAGGTVALAMSGLGGALDALNQAGLNPTEANMEAVGEALRQLAPAGREFVLFLDDLRPKLEDLQGLAQAGLLPGVEAGIRDALVLFPQLRELVGTTAMALGELAAEGGAALTDPFWANYINFLSQQAGPTIQQFGAVLGNVATGFAGMQMAFGDLTLDFGSGLERMSAQFAVWGRQLSQSEGFHDFAGYVREVTPQILDTIGAIAGAIGAVVQASAPIGPVMLQGLELLADVLAGIASVPVAGTTLIAVAAGLTLVSRAMRVYQATKGMQLLTTLEGYGRAGSRAAGGLRRAAGGLRAFGLAAAAVVTIVSLAQEDLTGYVAAVERAGGANQSTAAKVKSLQAELKIQQQIVNDALFTVGNWGLAWRHSGREINGAARKSDQLRERIQVLKETTDTASPRVQVLATKFGLTDEQATDAMNAVAGLDAELQAFFDLSFGVQEAQDAVTRGFRELKNQVQGTSGKLRGNSAAAVALREQMRQLVRDTGTLMVEEAKHANSLVEVKNKTQDNIDRFRRYAHRIGLNEDAVRVYTDALKAARIDVINKFKTEGLGKAKSGVVSLTDKLWELDGTYAVRLEGGGLGPKFSASGGRIDGPGGPTEDRVPVMASSGEYMVKTDSARKVGYDAMNYINRTGQLPGFADGGRISNADVNINARPLARYAGRRADYLNQFQSFTGGSGLDFAQRQDGEPYVWGGVGPYGWDCSGLWSGVVNAIRGRDPNSRLFSTASFSGGNGAAGFVRGLNSPVQVGVLPGSHMAGQIGGVHIESSGSHGVRVGGGARGAYNGMFSYQFGLAGVGGGSASNAGLANEGILADRGAVLPHGRWAYNTSGQTEQVLSNEQLRSLRTIARSVSGPRVTSLGPMGGDGASAGPFRDLYVQTTPQATAGEIINEAVHNVRVLRRGGR